MPNLYTQPGINKKSQHLLKKDRSIAPVDSPREREELVTSEDRIAHENNNVDHLVKGRSITFENTNYLLPLGFVLIEILKKVLECVSC
jgi:hypothetical protein